MAAVMTVIMVIMVSSPALAGLSPGLGEEFVTRNFTDISKLGYGISSNGDIAEEEEEADCDLILEDEILLASSSSAGIEYTVDGKAEDSIFFYVKRNSDTNETIDPKPVILTIRQTEGEADIGDIEVRIGTPETQNGTLEGKLEIVPVDQVYLGLGQTVSFEIRFIVSEDMKEGIENIYNDGRNFLVISGAGIKKRIPVDYGIDGLYTYYSAESMNQYEGSTFIDEMSGAEYRVVGHVKLNDEDPSTITIRHKFGVFGNMAGMDEQGKPVPLRIIKAYLDPNGNFTFANGSSEVELKTGEDGWISIPIRIKDEVFTEWRRTAVRQNKARLEFLLLADLILEYNDGYLAGGRVSPLPLVCAVSYIPRSSGGSGGSSGGGGGGGGGGSGSGGTTSTGTVQGGPAAAPRVTNASADDIGWVQKDGVWYYMDAANVPVTDWLLGPDGRWYFLGMGGMMKTGWMQLGTTWYFMNADGAMATGWVQDTDGKWYYLQQDGSMAVDTTTPDGYHVDQNGVWDR